MSANMLEYGQRPVARFLRRLRAVMVLAAVGVAMAACSSDDVDELALDETPAAQLYNEGLALANEGSYSRAAQKFADVDRLYPYSELGRKSMIMQTYSWYTSGNFPEAISAGKRYVTLYPGSEDAAYAQYIIGQSYFNQIPDVTRDQEMTERALDAMNELVRRYPESEYANDGRKKIQITRDQLAGKEMDVGRYYLRKRNYIASINRFKNVVQAYQTTRHVEEALARLTESYYSLGVISEAQTAAAVLGHNFPSSRWYKDAAALLKSGGYDPEENEQSWISKTFKSVNPFD